MSTNGRLSLERIGKVASFVLAWAIVGHQAWRTQYGQEPNEWLMIFAVSIIAPAAIQYVFPGRGGSEPSVPQPSSASSSSELSESGGG
jgi:hypothetical protein